MSEARSEKEYSQIENTLSYIFGCNKGCKSRNLLIYTLVCGERGKCTIALYLVVSQMSI